MYWCWIERDTEEIVCKAEAVCTVLGIPGLW